MHVHNVNTLFCVVFTKTDDEKTCKLCKEIKGGRAVNYYRGRRRTKRTLKRKTKPSGTLSKSSHSRVMYLDLYIMYVLIANFLPCTYIIEGYMQPHSIVYWFEQQSKQQSQNYLIKKRMHAKHMQFLQFQCSSVGDGFGLRFNRRASASQPSNEKFRIETSSRF